MVSIIPIASFMAQIYTFTRNYLQWIGSKSCRDRIQNTFVWQCDVELERIWARAQRLELNFLTRMALDDYRDLLGPTFLKIYVLLFGNEMCCCVSYFQLNKAH